MSMIQFLSGLIWVPATISKLEFGDNEEREVIKIGTDGELLIQCPQIREEF